MEKGQDFALDAFLEELEVFRWRLYIAKDESPKEKANLFEEACSKQISELFIEECLIAGCDTTKLSNESKLMLKKLMDKDKGEGDLLPSIQRDDDKFWDFSRLRMCLLYGNEPLFIKGIKMIARKNPTKLQEQIIANSSDLLNIAASGHLTLTIKTLVAYGGKVEYPAFLAACKTGSWQSLQTLMPHLDLEENKMPLLRELSISARNADEKDAENFEKCYDLLLNGSNFDVNSMDSHGRSAMYYVSHLPKKIDQFLEMGTYIGMQNGSTTPNVSFIAPAALEAHFNNCVNFVQSEDGKKITYLEFDYRNMIPPRHLDGNEDDGFMMPNEMTAIEFISQSVDYVHLLVHPLIWSFISMKWRQMTLIRNIDCALYLLFALSNLGYVISLYGNAPKEITTVFFLLNGNMTFYVAIRRIVHLLFCSDEYRKTMINHFHTYQTVQVIVSVTLVKYIQNIDPVVPAMCVLFISCELFTLAGSIFWTFSLYYCMFLSIAWSSLKSLMVYVVLLPSFIISYWLMMNNKKPVDNTYKTNFFDYTQKSLMANSTEDDANDSQLGFFKKNFFSLISTYFEDDSAEHEGTSPTVVSLMNAIIGWHRELDAKIAIVDWTFLGLLIVMISLVSVININLVSSLAVTGTHAIQSKSELTCLNTRVHLLGQYEDALTNRKHWFWQIVQNTCIMRLFDFFIQFDVLECVRQDNQRKIYIGPDNEIIYHIQSQNQSAKCGDVSVVSKVLFSANKGADVSSLTDENEDSTGSQSCCSGLWSNFFAVFFNKTDRMNPIIVENARNVIDRRNDDLKEKNDIVSCIHRIERLEPVLLELSKKIDLMTRSE